MNSFLRLLFIFLITIVSLAAAKPPSLKFHGAVGKSISNVELPTFIPADRGKLTLYVDYKKAQGGKVPIYLVNRTDKAISLPSQDHDIYLKLERKQANGMWIRAQTHQNSWCGNSYYNVELDPGQHFTFTGYLPAEGKAARVRFSSYSNLPLVSNEGNGLYLEQDCIASGVDQLASRQLPAPLRRYFQIRSEDGKSTRSRTEEDELLSALRLTSSYRESSYARSKIKAYLSLSKGNPSAQSRKFAVSAQKILDQSWPLETQPESLLQRSLEELPDHPIPAWLVLNDFLGKGISLKGGKAGEFERMVAEELGKALERGNSREIKAAVKLFDLSGFSGEYFTNQFFEKWIRSPHDSLLQACANALSRRGSYASLAKIGLEMKPSRQLLILRALASKGSPSFNAKSVRNPAPGIETRFWEQCAREQPKETAAMLYHMGPGSGYNRFNRTLHDPLRDYLRQEAKIPSKKVDAWELGRVVSFVASWKMKEDIPLFRALLSHPAYQRSTGSKSTRSGVRLEFFRYRVREEARRALISMGEHVPENLVIEEERVLPKKKP